VVNLRRGTTLVTVDGFKLLIASYLLKVANFNLPHHAAGIEAPAIPTPTIPTPVIPTRAVLTNGPGPRAPSLRGPQTSAHALLTTCFLSREVISVTIFTG